MKIIGLTGNIASGKSAISYILKNLGAEVLDLDKIGKQIQELNYKKVIEKIEKRFGKEIIENEKINRKKLGSIAFSDKQALIDLNSIMIPLMTEKLKRTIDENRKKETKVLVVDAAILFEANWDKFVDYVWVVYVPRETQINRLIKREKITQEEAIMRVDSQESIDEKIEKADVVIDNSKNLEAVKLKILELWNVITISI
ncbi:MAG: dephospho-CoA kinase [Caldiserica bacterium CG_4_8_14_3_um_filter_35_18]|nr:dephospho-CoA kinase [Caldisericota bacterium]PIX29751.1 MAG: dephospho-CoA kinase [Caldiserica bacterium CG_4_8_14_3_um_filter_35_18]